jgi:hypothetical protein
MRRRNENRLHFLGSQKHPRKNFVETFILEPPDALKNLLACQQAGTWGQESPGFLVLKRELGKSISR